MTGDLEAYLRDPEKGGDARYGGVLRRALEDLLKMSSTAVEPLESRIESEHRDAKASAQREFDRDKEKIERQFQLRSEEIRRKRDAEVEEAESDFASRLSVLKMDVQQRRRRVLDIAKELVGKAQCPGGRGRGLVPARRRPGAPGPQPTAKHRTERNADGRADRR